MRGNYEDKGWCDMRGLLFIWDVVVVSGLQLSLSLTAELLPTIIIITTTITTTKLKFQPIPRSLNLALYIVTVIQALRYHVQITSAAACVHNDPLLAYLA